MQIFDSHAHYNDEKFELDREETLQKVLDAGVKNLIYAQDIVWNLQDKQ